MEKYKDLNKPSALGSPATWGSPPTARPSSRWSVSRRHWPASLARVYAACPGEVATDLLVQVTGSRAGLLNGSWRSPARDRARV